MFSISKALALVAILAAVWFGFKLIGRLDAARKRKVDQSRRGAPDKADDRTAGPKDGVLDLVRDESGAYVAKEKRDDRV